MKAPTRMRLALLAVGLVAAPAAAAQSPPPLGVKVLMAASPHMDESRRAANEALLASLESGATAGGGWFRFMPSGLDTERYQHCTISAQDSRECVRRYLERDGATGATVVVLASGRGADAAAQWLCVGLGKRLFNPERQSITLDLEAALDPASPTYMQQRAAAAGCITSAAAESGW
ncbi:hypothetical protein [Brevundimonas sp. LjRoot202]|uniref:hypothetical protein n=1 Tax=Brevundimonas sp. LjRoot202 TaxID=3342281 RepID=UPI003ECD206A